MSGANREYVDRTCLHDEVCIYREEHMRKGVERMNKSRVTEYILAYMQDYKEPLLAEEFLEHCVFLQLSPEAIAKTIRK